MTRRELRESTFVLLFRADFHTCDDMPEQIELYFETQGINLEGDDKIYTNPR